MNALSRREFLRVSALAGAASIVSACVAPSPTPPQDQAGGQPAAAPTEAGAVAPEGQPASQYKEPPVLADRVAKGELPPIAERLPEDPAIIQPYEGIGRYGGTMNLIALTTPQFGADYMQYEGLIRVAMDGVEVIPNIASSWEQDENAQVFTFHLRKGLRFRDGEPLTADDLVYWLEDQAKDPDLNPGGVGWLKVGGAMPAIRKIDDFTVEYRYEATAPLFIRQMAYAGRLPYSPQHYLSQFHGKYADSATLQQLTAEKGFDTWAQLYAAMADWQTNPDCPMVFPWELGTASQTGNQYPRNPYYWKVDPEGNQLPYIDDMKTVLGSSVEVCQMMAFSGEGDWAIWTVGQTPEATMILKKNAELGGYTVITAPISEPNVGVLGLNQNHPDPVLRELFRDKRFRMAASLAINRDDVREVVYLGQSIENRQVAPLERSPFYHEAAAKAYVEYDPDRANALLDEMGLDQRDQDGYRLRPDGQTLSIVLEVLDYREDYMDLGELVAKWWRDVGINATSRSIERALWDTKRRSADMQATIGFSGGGLFPTLRADSYIPNLDNSLWAPLWGKWNATDGQEGEEPPAEVQRQLELYKQMLVTPDEGEQLTYWNEIMDIQAESLYSIGFCDRAPVPVVVSLKMRNVPMTGWDCGWEGGLQSTTNPCQYWKEE